MQNGKNSLICIFLSIIPFVWACASWFNPSGSSQSPVDATTPLVATVDPRLAVKPNDSANSNKSAENPACSGCPEVLTDFDYKTIPQGKCTNIDWSKYQVMPSVIQDISNPADPCKKQLVCGKAATKTLWVGYVKNEYSCESDDGYDIIVQVRCTDHKMYIDAEDDITIAVICLRENTT